MASSVPRRRRAPSRQRGNERASLLAAARSVQQSSGQIATATRLTRTPRSLVLDYLAGRATERIRCWRRYRTRAVVCACDTQERQQLSENERCATVSSNCFMSRSPIFHRWVEFDGDSLSFELRVAQQSEHCGDVGYISHLDETEP